MELRISYRTPGPTEYNELRQLVGWPTFDTDLAKEGLANSIFGVVVVNEHDLILGMGRIIGDKAIYLHIQDVIVRPEFQGKGVGKLIMSELLKYADKLGGRNTNIGLMSSVGRENFYKNFGFMQRPSDKFGAGMIKIKH